MIQVYNEPEKCPGIWLHLCDDSGNTDKERLRENYLKLIMFGGIFRAFLRYKHKINVWILYILGKLIYMSNK